MDVTTRVDEAIARHLSGRDSPPRLGDAVRHALYPGGARVRPRFAISVALACGDDRPVVSDAIAAAVEYLHCASLVHDDLPCFDNAAMRRGRPSVHAAHGEALAVLAGDALIVMAFQALADVGAAAADRLPALVRIVADSAGMPGGLVGGQGLESEVGCDLARYHFAKTGVLFEAAAGGGATAAGGDVDFWRTIGRGLGAAYQIADDIYDHVGSGERHGKPVGRDVALGRPSAVAAFGLDGAMAALRTQIEETSDLLPDGPTGRPLRQFLRDQIDRFVPATLLAGAPA